MKEVTKNYLPREISHRYVYNNDDTKEKEEEEGNERRRGSYVGEKRYIRITLLLYINETCRYGYKYYGYLQVWLQILWLLAVIATNSIF